jgi:predicted DNA-binding antitoxin AbrB/MazE fold protein
MKNEIIAVYENGILRPLTPLDLKENQKVNLKITKRKSIVLQTKGMVQGNPKYLKEIAESEELAEWNL